MFYINGTDSTHGFKRYVINAWSTESGPISVTLGVLGQSGTTRASVEIAGLNRMNWEPAFFFVSPDLDARQIVVRQVNGTQGAVTCSSEPVTLVDEQQLSSTPFVDQMPAQISPLEAKPVDVRTVRNPQPDYPDLSKERGEQGTSIVRIRVDPQGLVIDSAVSRSSGFRGLDGAALSAAQRLKFSPPTILGEPVTLLYDVEYRFLLR